MAKTGLLIDMKCKPGRDDDVEAMLRDVLPMAREDPATQAWIAVRFARERYGIFGEFADGTARETHLRGPLVRALKGHKGDLFSRAPELHKIDIVEDVVKPNHELQDSKGFLLTFRPRPGREADLEKYLREQHPFVFEDPRTSAWFAVRLDDGSYGIFDIFPDSERVQELTGMVPNDLARHAGALLRGTPKLDMLTIAAEKLPTT